MAQVETHEHLVSLVGVITRGNPKVGGRGPCASQPLAACRPCAAHRRPGQVCWPSAGQLLTLLPPVGRPLVTRWSPAFPGPAARPLSVPRPSPVRPPSVPCPPVGHFTTADGPVPAVRLLPVPCPSRVRLLLARHHPWQPPPGPRPLLLRARRASGRPKEARRRRGRLPGQQNRQQNKTPTRVPFLDFANPSPATPHGAQREMGTRNRVYRHSKSI